MTYKINNREYKTWSGKNQHIIDKLVSREVYCIMTHEVEFMLQSIDSRMGNNPFDEDDLMATYEDYCCECDSADLIKTTSDKLKDSDYITENGITCPCCETTYNHIAAARECCAGSEVYKCESCGKIFEVQEASCRPAEIYEWWAVSSWFGEKLSEQGCVVISAYGKSYWGRTTTGQSISLDGCVANIAISMEILEGMEHEWGE